MRLVAPIALALLLTGCALPFGLKWPRLPWHKPKAEYCIVSLEAGNANGISVGNEAAVHMPCSAPSKSRRRQNRSAEVS